MADPKTFIGLLIGGSVPFLFSALAIRAVGRSAGTVVLEVRRQFREHPGIMDYTERPEYGRVIDICTQASLRELATPALLAVLTPAIIGFGIRYLALGAFLAAVILTGQLMANFLSNSGGAWDNAKKYIEDGHEGGKGSEAHKAAVIGDTVGDPFKDTAGPALNPLIKVMNLVSLLILPAVISLRDNDGARYAIALGVSGRADHRHPFSKRKTVDMSAGLDSALVGAAPTAIEAPVGRHGPGHAAGEAGCGQEGGDQDRRQEPEGHSREEGSRQEDRNQEALTRARRDFGRVHDRNRDTWLSSGGEEFEERHREAGNRHGSMAGIAHVAVLDHVDADRPRRHAEATAFAFALRAVGGLAFAATASPDDPHGGGP